MDSLTFLGSGSEEIGTSSKQLTLLAQFLKLPIEGVFPDDQLPKKIKPDEMGIVNLQHHNQPGTHWVAYFNSSDDLEVFSYDPLGFPPDEYLEPYLKTAVKSDKKKTPKKLEFWEYQTQPDTSSLCGFYCLFFLYYIYHGDMFADVISRFENETLKLQQNEDIVKEFIVQKLYENPQIGLVGIDDFIEKLSPFLPGITRKEIKKYINSMELVQTHRVQKEPKVFRHFQSYKPNEWSQADDVHLYLTKSGYRYLLTVIDVYSRYLKAIPLMNENSKLTIEAFKKAYDGKPLSYPKYLSLDRGSNFISKEVADFFQKKGVNIIYTAPGEKRFLGVINRAQRTLEEALYKWMEKNNSQNWDEALSECLDKYNYTKHNAVFGTTVPAEVMSGEQKPVYKDYSSSDTFKPHKPKYKIGDKVRLFTKKENGKRRATDTNFTTEIFTVIDIREARPGLVGVPEEPITYSIEDSNEPHGITTNVYESEITSAR